MADSEKEREYASGFTIDKMENGWSRSLGVWLAALAEEGNDKSKKNLFRQRCVSRSAHPSADGDHHRS
jgi:hypothetical protein